ncbi:bifunctional ADP-dependent (S)-NAD(P)H-hydrate dehydratase/NAD(P)H-hydrate epimerase [Pseudactinotalea sp. HY160]|uniref:bifunctional ADP-dependent NAD(P)H-hydrate dehydratase/NAD(P)H-hydrate epimerase n=1 Tax=Pseudactinotalea sp. HY160 TaxID=2654490 RepID=UPI00128C7E83|nr:bifunctional ADP-dependent NAD(P)H-hydrate dehydratase/NAD(P)H-hydrate epimerase [Pseudactinotalea sp. HY160]MPV50764.1 bifunctional ADP-dependent (S)-NAD(P)H-hydrate dehydratase/NAD(P)H-hydrate epimerase [Pseudactinotalea sp. HY160]
MSAVPGSSRPVAAYAAEHVRAAEAPLLAAGVPLMRRAAAALAETVRAELPPGTGVLVIAGRGNNGGDGLFAAAELARAGIAVTVALAQPIEPTDDAAHRPMSVAEPGPGQGLAAARREGAVIVPLWYTGETLPGTLDPADQADPAAPDGAGSPRWSALDEAAAGAAVWIDALTGLGLRPPLRGRLGDLLEHLLALRRRHRPIVVAADLPSGMAADSGALTGPVLPADVTVTFGCAKPALLLPPACHAAGRIEVVDLGLTEELSALPVAVRRLDGARLGAEWPAPGPGDHKYTRGVVGVIAGSATYPGAAVLCTGAAIRAGAGMVRYLGSASAAVLAARPEAVTAPGRVQSWVIGPGLPGLGNESGDLGDPGNPADPDMAAALRAATEAIAAGAALVLDAGGLDLLTPGEASAEGETARRTRIGGRILHDRVLLTPHAGELARLLTRFGVEAGREQIEADPAHWAARAAEATGATVLLKGAVTLVAAPAAPAPGAGGAASTIPLYSQADGTPWLATAGSGDVLAGILGTALAQLPPGSAAAATARASAMAAAIHGRAGVLAGARHDGGPIAAADIVGAVPCAIGAVLRLARGESSGGVLAD